MKKQKRWNWKRSIIVIVILAVAFLLWYVNDYYHSDETVDQYMDGNTLVETEEIDQGLYIDGPGNESALIFIREPRWNIRRICPCYPNWQNRGLTAFL